LSQGLDGQTLAVPVIYPGSIERTSFAERLEEKYYVMIHLESGSEGLDQVIDFRRLPSRPMVKVDIPAHNKSIAQLKSIIQTRLAELDPNAVVRLELSGPNAYQFQASFTAAALRTLAPDSMNIALGNGRQYSGHRTRSQEGVK
jgi:DNA repair exonuclease SbcCD nuclease subunit